MTGVVKTGSTEGERSWVARMGLLWGFLECWCPQGMASWLENHHGEDADSFVCGACGALWFYKG